MLQLYLLEIFIEDIHFAKNINPCPKPTDLIITASVNNFLSFEIQIAEFTDFNDNTKPSDNINFNSGKSCLFPITPQDLITMFENNPLLIVVSTIGKCLAVIKINWDKQFFAMITKTMKNPGKTSPVSVREKLVLKDEQTNANIGDITAQIRLICFGDQIQSNYRALTTGAILVKSQQDSIIFQCQRYDESSGKSSANMLPLYYPNTGNVGPEMKLTVPPTEPAPTLAPQAPIPPSPTTMIPAPLGAMPTSALGGAPPVGSEFSTITILSNQFQPNFSVFNADSVATFDIVSLVKRPEENKFLSLGFVQDYSGRSNGISSNGQSNDNSNNKLTTEKINRSLCKNRNCPAAIKFKEYGIGPLANGTGLGTVTNYVKLPAKYGLSNTYGTFEYYGPYGLLSKPDEGRRETTKPLRLNGGGGINYQTIRNPFVECRDIMREFDRILEKFRTSLSPCGQANCPQAQNILKDLKKDDLPPILSGNCNQPTMCYSTEKKLPPIHWDCPEPLPEGPCKNPECPYLPDDIKELNRCYIDTNRSKRQSQMSCEIGSTGMCGNSTCPYADTASITCKNSKCPFRYPEVISNIPQELQKFVICENPSCPYLTKNGDQETLLTEVTVDSSKPKKTPYRPCIEADENPSPVVEYTSNTRIETDENLCELNKCCAKCANISSDDKIVKPKPKRVRKKQRFDYTIGNQYPGVKFGHHQCKPAGSSVPANQGWLWNIYKRRGWRPGVIPNTIAVRIREHWERKGIPMLRLKQFQRGCVKSEEELIDIEAKPTLQVQKRDGHYYITLHPLKDPRTVGPNEDPYMNCTPLQFKVTDPKIFDTSEACVCTNKSESTSDSDLDIEFTSPAGLIHPERLKRKPNIVHCDTQYDPKDFDETLRDGKKKKDKKDKKNKKDKKKKKKGK